MRKRENRETEIHQYNRDTDKVEGSEVLECETNTKASSAEEMLADRLLPSA